MSGTIPVRFEPGGVTVWAQRGCTVLEAARDAGVVLDAPCAGRGVCGGCAVRVLSGSLDAPDEEELAGLRRAPTGVRLACRAAIVGPATLQPVVAHAARGIPAASTVGVVEREPVASPRLVAAVDLGTSTVASVVIERDSRREIGRGVVANRQYRVERIGAPGAIPPPRTQAPSVQPGLAQ